MEWLWIAAVVPALLLALLLCPVRYRMEASRESGRFSVSVLCGLYTKTLKWEKKKETKASLSMNGKEENTASPEKKKTKKNTAGFPQKGKADGALHKKGKENKGTAEAAETPKRMFKGELLSLAWKNGTVRLALRTIGRVIRHSAPGFFLVEGRAGLSDPADTGMAAGMVMAFLPARCSRVEWVFTEKCMDLSAKAAGRIVPLYLLCLAVGFAASRSVRETMRAYKKMHNS